jgi:hypothetical protein
MNELSMEAMRADLGLRKVLKELLKDKETLQLEIDKLKETNNVFKEREYRLAMQKINEIIGKIRFTQLNGDEDEQSTPMGEGGKENKKDESKRKENTGELRKQYQEEAYEEIDLKKNLIEKQYKVYLPDGSNPPEGHQVLTGERGGKYYVTDGKHPTINPQYRPQITMNLDDQKAWHEATSGKTVDHNIIRALIEKNPELVKREIYLPRSNHPEGGYETKPAVFLRFGRPPKDGDSSFNGFLNRKERGVSTYLAWYDPKTKKYVLDDAGSSEFGDYVSTQDSLVDMAIKGQKKLYKITGLPTINDGGDAETLLYPDTVKIESEISLDDVVNKEEPGITLSGKELSEEETPAWEPKVIEPSDEEFSSLKRKYDENAEKFSKLNQEHYELRDKFIELSKNNQITAETAKPFVDNMHQISALEEEQKVLSIKIREKRNEANGWIKKQDSFSQPNQQIAELSNQVSTPKKVDAAKEQSGKNEVNDQRMPFFKSDNITNGFNPDTSTLYEQFDSILSKSHLIGPESKHPHGVKQLAEKSELDLYRNLRQSINLWFDGVEKDSDIDDVLANLKMRLTHWSVWSKVNSKEDLEQLYNLSYQAGRVKDESIKISVDNVFYNEHGLGPALDNFRDKIFSDMSRLVRKYSDKDIPLYSLKRSIDSDLRQKRIQTRLMIKTEVAKIGNTGLLKAWNDDAENKYKYNYFWNAVLDERTKKISRIRAEGNPYSADEISFLWKNQSQIIDGKIHNDVWNQRCWISRELTDKINKDFRFSGKESEYRES